MTRQFSLIRDEDTGPRLVAEGCEFSDGSIAIRWPQIDLSVGTMTAFTAFRESLAHVEAMSLRIEWADDAVDVLAERDGLSRALTEIVDMHLPSVTAERDRLASEIQRLADFIAAEVSGEPQRAESAVANAIGAIEDLMSRVDWASDRDAVLVQRDRLRGMVAALEAECAAAEPIVRAVKAYDMAASAYGDAPTVDYGAGMDRSVTAMGAALDANFPAWLAARGETDE